MQKIIVKSVDKKKTKTDKTFYVIKDTAGVEFSTFNMMSLKINPGDTIEGEVTTKGQYNNLDDGFTITPGAGTIQSPSPQEKPPTPQPVRSYGKSPEELASIEGNTAVSRVFDYIIACQNNKIQLTPDLNTLFDKALVWCDAKINIKISPPKPQQVSGQPKQADSATVTKPDDNDIASLKMTQVQFTKWMGNNKVSVAEVQQAMGHPVTQIADFDAACNTIQTQIIDKRGK